MSELLQSSAVPPTAAYGITRKLLAKPTAVVSLAIVAMWIIVALLGPFIMPYGPNRTDLGSSNLGPGPDHLLGTDRSGRDIMSRLIAGAGDALESSLIASVVAILVGVTTGLLAGYYGRAWDAIGTWVSNVLIAVPGVIVLIALYAAVGPSTTVAMLTLGLLLAPSFYRLTRGLVLGVKHELYVDAARISGVSDTRIIGRHIVAVIRTPVIVQCAFAAGVAITLQAGLAFLGLSDANKPSWGGMLQEGFSNLYIAPMQIVWPGVALGIVTSALILLGSCLTDVLEGIEPRPIRRKGAVIRKKMSSAADGDRALLDVRSLSISYPTKDGRKHVVRDVSLTVNRGEIVGLVGESGSGKTQTAFAILGVLPEEASVDGGEMTFVTKRGIVHERRLLGRSVAYVPQEPMSNLDPTFTVGAQLLYGIRATKKISRRDARTLAESLLSRVGIPHPRRTMKSYPHEISGGMAQRVLIAGALASDPELLIADEPTTALDVTVQAEILALLRSIQQERDMGMLLVTHNLGVVADLCDRVTVMRSGEDVETAPTLDIFQRPQHEYTRKLLGAVLDVDTVRDPELEPEWR